MGKSVAIILARGGSKRVPHKNIRAFCGQPMVTWAVSHAVKSNLFSQVIISTDDEEIAQAAISCGAAYYGPRPPELSNDHATTADVLRYVLNSLQSEITALKTCCCLYGTSAMVTPEMLMDGLALLQNKKSELVMSLMRYSHPIERALVINDDEMVIYRTPEFASTRTQDLRESYHDAGLFYWLRTSSFLTHNHSDFSRLKKCGLIVSRFDAVDIDTEDEWTYAEKLAQMHNLGR